MLSLSRASAVLIEEEVLSSGSLANLFPNAEVRNCLFQNRVLVPDKAGFVKVKFVGVVAADGLTVQVLPKIFANSGSNVKPIMAQVIRCLRRYAKFKPQNEVEVPFLDPASDSAGLNALAISDWLIRDYLNGGIYRRVRDRQQRNGQGQVNWGRTIDQIPPVSSQGQLLYLETLNRSATNDNSNFISRLHRQVVAMMSSEFGHLLGYTRLNLESEPYEPFVVLPDVSLAKQKVREEMRDVFSDRSIQLLPMILAAITAFERAKASKIALYGTTSFYDVWERACSLLIGNERELWTASIPRPLWTSLEGTTQPAKTFVPDIVTRIPIASQEHLLIADAKYYRLFMPPDLIGQPGVNDVAKQLWYQQYLTQPALERGISTIHNVFLVPDSTDRSVLWADGSVTLGDTGNKTIKIIRLSGAEALARYADGVPLDINYVGSVVMGA